MSEWFKVHAWKACVPKRYRGFESPSFRIDESFAVNPGAMQNTAAEPRQIRKEATAGRRYLCRRLPGFFGKLSVSGPLMKKKLFLPFLPFIISSLIVVACSTNPPAEPAGIQKAKPRLCAIEISKGSIEISGKIIAQKQKNGHIYRTVLRTFAPASYRAGRRFTCRISENESAELVIRGLERNSAHTTFAAEQKNGTRQRKRFHLEHTEYRQQ